MTVTALVSGGKDSLYAAYLADCQGWPVDELVTIRPTDPESRLFHTPNLELVALQAAAWGRRHRVVPVDGVDDAAELRALDRALGGATGPVIAGAIASSFQWSRLLAVAGRHGRRVYAPLWRVAPGRVVREELAAGLRPIFVHLAAEPLPAEWVGGPLDAGRLADLERLSGPSGRLNVAGEGGEYETLVVDAPFFASRIEIAAARTVVGPSTSRYDISSAHLKRKEPVEPFGRSA